MESNRKAVVLMTRDLTHGNPARVILNFAIPILLGMLLQQVYNLVDTMIVGRFVGVDALGGVGSTGSLNFMILGSCIGLCMGFGIPAANAFGARDLPQLRRFVANSIYLCAILSAVIMTVVLVFCRQILTAMHTTAETFSYAYDYIYWIFWGIPFVMLYNMTASVIRAVGDSKSPLLFLAIAAGLNVVLDLLFILGFRMGVAGAAWATNLSQGISGLLCLGYMRKRLPVLRFQPSELRFNRVDALQLLANGVPMGLQYFITAIGSVTLQSAVNALGTTCVNAVAVGNKLNQMLACPFDALGTAMATYCGQNVGAHRLGRIRSGLRVAVGLSAVFAGVYLAIAWFLTPSISLLFLDRSETAIIELVRHFLVTVAAFSWAVGLINGFRFSIQGMGYSNLAIFSGVLEMLARVCVATFLVPALGFQGVCLGHPAAWLVADCFLLPTAYACLRRLRRRIPEDAPEQEEPQPVMQIKKA